MLCCRTLTDAVTDIDCFSPLGCVPVAQRMIDAILPLQEVPIKSRMIATE